MSKTNTERKTGDRQTERWKIQEREDGNLRRLRQNHDEKKRREGKEKRDNEKAAKNERNKGEIWENVTKRRGRHGGNKKEGINDQTRHKCT